MAVNVLGISAFYHDSAAALLRDGEIVAAAQEERFSRKKHDARFPVHALNYCLAEAGVSLAEVDRVAFYDKPFLKFERLLETYLACAPRGFKSFRIAIPVWLREKLFQKDLLAKELKKLAPGGEWLDRLLFSEHHLSHAASAFFPTPFEEALVLTMDGVGEWATTSAAIGRGNNLEIFKEIHFPHSLGLLYSAMTYYVGFKVNSGEYKVMGLAPYGHPRWSCGASRPPPGASYELRVPTGRGAAVSACLASLPADKRVSYRKHVVCRGQTLVTIARANGVSAQAIAEANLLAPGKRLRPGTELVIPVPAGKARVVPVRASLGGPPPGPSA